MKIALLDVDSKIPNLALMKLSAYHKQKGDSIEWYGDLWADTYDRIYCSKVFTWTPKPSVLSDRVEYGGSGFNHYSELTNEQEHIMPDYDLYGKKYSMGFTTRGCPRNCKFCIVPKKEGNIRKVADISEFLHPEHSELVLLDNNIFALKNHFEDIAEQVIEAGVSIDFNQGLDIRLLTDERAKLLKRMKPSKQWRFAFDSFDYEDKFRNGAEMLIKNKISKSKICVYILVGFDDSFNDALKRINIVYNEYGFDPFVMLYRSQDGKSDADEKYRKIKKWGRDFKDYKDLARWVNHKAIFKSVKWENYK